MRALGKHTLTAGPRTAAHGRTGHRAGSTGSHPGDEPASPEGRGTGMGAVPGARGAVHGVRGRGAPAAGWAGGATMGDAARVAARWHRAATRAGAHGGGGLAGADAVDPRRTQVSRWARGDCCGRDPGRRWPLRGHGGRGGPRFPGRRTTGPRPGEGPAGWFGMANGRVGEPCRAHRHRPWPGPGGSQGGRTREGRTARRRCGPPGRKGRSSPLSGPAGPRRAGCRGPARGRGLPRTANGAAVRGYPMTVLGSTASSPRQISKWTWTPAADSTRADEPALPMAWPRRTCCPASTEASARLA